MSSANPDRSSDSGVTSPSIATNQPGQGEASGTDKRHQLTVPTPLSGTDIRRHLDNAMEAVAVERRLAVFNPVNTQEQWTLIITNDISSPEFAIQLLDDDDVPIDTLHRSKSGVIDYLASILGTDSRERGGGFYTKSAVGGVTANGNVLIDKW